MSDEVKACVVMVARDLIFETKVRSTAEALGKSAVIVRSAKELESIAGRRNVALVLVDLGSAGGEALAAIRAAIAMTSRPRIIAFGSHVDVDALEGARAAGADEVMARSRFVAELVGLLSGDNGTSRSGGL